MGMLAHLTTVRSSAGARRRGFRAELLVAPVIFVTGVVVGWASLSGSDALGGGDWVTPERTASADLLWNILGRNLSAALLLFSGAYTAGFSTILALGLLSTYVGATFGAAAGSVGVSDALSSVILYAPLEFAGLLLAATAGLTPVFAFVRSSFTEKPGSRPIAAYVSALRPALRRLCHAVILIGVAGAVETIVISNRY